MRPSQGLGCSRRKYLRFHCFKRAFLPENPVCGSQEVRGERWGMNRARVPLRCPQRRSRPGPHPGQVRARPGRCLGNVSTGAKRNRVSNREHTHAMTEQNSFPSCTVLRIVSEYPNSATVRVFPVLRTVGVFHFQITLTNGNRQKANI